MSILFLFFRWLQMLVQKIYDEFFVNACNPLQITVFAKVARAKFLTLGVELHGGAPILHWACVCDLYIAYHCLTGGGGSLFIYSVVPCTEVV